MTENYSLHLNLKQQRIDSLQISEDMQMKILNELIAGNKTNKH